MVKINFNQKLFNTHIEKISEKIKQNLGSIDRRNLSEETINCLNYLDNEIENILKANINQLKSIIDFFQTHYPNSIGIGNQKEENWQELYKILRQEIFEKEYNLWSGRKKYGAYTFVKELVTWIFELLLYSIFFWCVGKRTLPLYYISNRGAFQ